MRIKAVTQLERVGVAEGGRQAQAASAAEPAAFAACPSGAQGAAKLLAPERAGANCAIGTEREEQK
jgi:hypothetical protein